MDVEEEYDGFADTFIETPAILDKYKGAAGIANGKYHQQDGRMNSRRHDDMC